jgi:plasmid stability protein
MRTTLTLDDDVAARLKSLMRQDGRSLKATVNDLLRLALSTKRVVKGRKPFRVEARDLGGLRPGLNLDNVGDMLEQLEGPRHR